MYSPLFALASWQYFTQSDWLRIVHPSLAVTFVFPIVGVVVNFAWLTRQKRLERNDKIAAGVGGEHLRLGKILTAAVVGSCLLGLLHPTVKYIIKNDLGSKAPFQVVFLVLMFVLTIGSLVILYRAREAIWRYLFAVLTSLGVLVIGFQDLLLRRAGFGAIFRRDNEWYLSHFYFGTAVTILMIISLAIVPEIYRDRSEKVRLAHALVNTFAVILFIGQGFTGARDLLEIPLSWQEPAIWSCDFQNRVCGGQGK
ncbi:MAG: DUF4079 domain-containing protein [Pseudanabaenaceae cyanobacterium SKYGB_i_bin29]|nr:DUF4079 domain-containing protein [Pseudanabaenaceae cyanobacterium SKYG29]MDW8421535.1 DUF4079 domain-containing protein [Pseudanabaenaceae cyanobacterium SKYGB_i_bin29]